MTKKTSHIHDYLVVHVPALRPNLQVYKNPIEYEILAENIRHIQENTFHKVILVVEGLVEMGKQTMKEMRPGQKELMNSDLGYQAIGVDTLGEHWRKMFSHLSVPVGITAFPEQTISGGIMEHIRNFKTQVDSLLDLTALPIIFAKDAEVIGGVCEVLHPENVYSMVHGMPNKAGAHKIIHTQHLSDKEINAAIEDAIGDIGAGNVFRHQILGFLRAHTVEQVTLFDGSESTLIEQVNESANAGVTFLV